MTRDADLLSDARRRLPAARKALQAALGDLPSRNGAEGVSGGGTGEWGPTVTIALTLAQDEAVRDSRRLDKLMLLMAARCRHAQPITQQLSEVIDICDRWAPTAKRKTALEDNLRAAANDQLNTVKHNDCQSCIRAGAREPARTEGSRLCRWCEDWVRALNDPDGDWAMQVDMPTEQMVKARRDGRLLSRHLPPRKKWAR